MTKKLDIDLKNGLEYYLVIDLNYMHSRVRIKEVASKRFQDRVFSAVAKQIQYHVDISDYFYSALKKVLNE